MLTAIIYDKWLAGLGGGEVVACEAARTLKDNGYDVLFLSRDVVTKERIRETLGIDLSDVEFKQVSNEQEINSLIASHYPLTTDLFINLSFMDYSYGIGKKNVYYVHFPSQIRSGLFNYVLLFFQLLKKILPATDDQRLTTNNQPLMLKSLTERIEDRLRAGVYPDMRKRLDSYDTFICHSEYVQKWIKKLWNKNAHVLYPPVKLINSKPSTLNLKQNWICSVGRFFTLGHGKKQEIMIEAFKELYSELTTSNSPLATDLQLHLIGGVGSEPSSLRFIEDLREKAKGYPIFFHFNVKRDEVEEILLKSKIYWHAGGYEETNPINFEHFGIAPVEAISAGCVPILFDGGGLPEIINALNFNPAKHLFQSIPELISNTRFFLKQKVNSNSEMYKNSLDENFSSFHFSKKFLDIVNG